MLHFISCNKKRLAIRHMYGPLFPTTLSIPSYDIGNYVGLRTYQHPSYKCLTEMSATASDALMKQDHTVRVSNVRVLVQSLAWEADSRSPFIGILRLLLSPNVHYRSHESVPPASVQCHLNPVDILELCETSTSISSSVPNRFGFFRSDDPYTYYYCHLDLRTNQTARDASTVTPFFIPPCGNPDNASNEIRLQISCTASQTSINIHFSCWTRRINKPHRKTFAGNTLASSHRILRQPAPGPRLSQQITSFSK